MCYQCSYGGQCLCSPRLYRIKCWSLKTANCGTVSLIFYANVVAFYIQLSMHESEFPVLKSRSLRIKKPNPIQCVSKICKAK